MAGGDVVRTARPWVVAGWLIFVASSLGFIVSAWKAGDMWALGGAVLFFLACIVFLVPVLGRME